MRTRELERQGAGVGRRQLAVFLLRQVGWQVDAVRAAAGLAPGSVGVYVTRTRRALDRRLRAG